MAKEMSDFMKEMMIHQKRQYQFDKICKSKLVQGYYKWSKEIKEQNLLPFIMIGNVNWKSGQDEGIQEGDITLISKCYDPNGKHVLDNPVRNAMQRDQAIWEFAGTVNVNIDYENIEQSKEVLEKTITRILQLGSVMSFWLGSRFEFIPARRIEVQYKNIDSQSPQKEEKKYWEFIPMGNDWQRESIIQVTDDHINGMFEVFKSLEGVPHPHKDIILGAMSWYNAGNNQRTDISAFLNFWNVIEMTSKRYSDIVDMKTLGKMNKGEKKVAVMEVLKGISQKNCLGKVIEASKIVQPSTKNNILAIFGCLTSKTDIENQLFGLLEGVNKSMYNFRNDVAHGNYTNLDLNGVGEIKEIIHKMKTIARNSILKLIQNYNNIPLKETEN